MKKIVIKILFVIIMTALVTCAFISCEKEPAQPTPDGDNCQHVYDDWSIVEEPTETESGIKQRKCTVCGEFEFSVVPMLTEKDYTLSVKEGTCEEEGKKVYSSDEYGTFEIVLDKLEHEYQRTVISELSCVDDNVVECVCKNCGYTYQVTVKEATGHDYKDVEVVAPTCTTKGYTLCECSKCEKTIKTNELDYAHKWGEGVYTAGDCSHYGETQYICELCEESKKILDEEYTHDYNKNSGKCNQCGSVCKHQFDESGYNCTICKISVYEELETDGYFLVDENANGEADLGESVYFGWYPKNYVGDTELVSTLKTLTVSEDGYYHYNGERYCRRTLNQLAKSMIKFSNGSYMANIHIEKEDYFYLVQPILWVVEGFNDEGKALLTTKEVIDVVDFQDGYKYSEIKGAYYVTNDDTGAISEVYANSWEYSYVREYLNGSFIENNFNDVQRSLMVSVSNDNNESNYYSSDYAQNDDTVDRVFIKAYGELFGESESYDSESEERVKVATDFTLGGGIIIKYDYYSTKEVAYYTRSVGANTGSVCAINEVGSLERSVSLDKTTSGAYGLVPSVYVNLE